MICCNGEFVAGLDNTSPDFLLAYTSQHALTECVRVEGGRVVFWELHYFRLMASMRILRMDIPMNFTPEQLQLWLLEVANGKSTLLNISVFGAQAVKKEIPQPSTYFCIQQNSAVPIFTHLIEDQPFDLYKDHYLTSGLLSQIESTHGQLRNTAWVYMHENDFSDGILLNEKKHLVGSLKGSLFLVQDKTVITPSLSSGARSSVYRSKSIELLKKKEGWSVEEREVTPFELQKMEECFIIDSLYGIVSYTRYRKKTYTTEKTLQLVKGFMTHYRLG